ncbi:condensation domain-containing protein [Crocosphaera watsonii]|uniref:Malonyl CoA-acyl carrier protein transacylase n=2 Tax=Crocosphaera watsonii TaxID=263511 RepID=G5JCW7_CROWT|nr:condensation domain-containing protein [Crocosphaera watsonii]EHJ09977.1 Malonyl CoA-acyl carrier protein transacylase [Crocosphaera watsonii WH 0003]CCQ58139.1 Condensation domain [Crocosphaera watsonii WH 0005]
MSSVERKLGSIENLFHIIQEFGGMIDVNIARIEGNVQPDILQKTLLLLQNRYPLLRVHIIELEDGAYFSSHKIKQIPLQVITKTDENQWVQIAESELHKKFSQNFHPLCRITLLKSSSRDGISEIIATFHHAISDGLSCLNFLENLLIYYNEILNKKEIAKNISLAFPAPIEHKLERSLVTFQNIKDINDEERKDTFSPQLIIESEAPLPERHTRIVTRIINSKNLLNLEQQCQTQRTTIHGALWAATLLATKTISNFGEPLHLACSSNLNLRQYSQTEIDSNNLGCFFSSVENIYTLTKDMDFWELARDCQQKFEMGKGQTINNLINTQRLAKFTKINLENILEQNSTGRTKAINISNRGKFNLAKNYGQLKIQEIYFSVGQHILGPCLWLGTVIFHEKLCLSLAHVTPLISSKTMNSFADSVVTILKKVSSPQQ